MAKPGRCRSPLYGPLAQSQFRQLWLAWLAGNVAMWMHEVTASWRMAQLTDDAMMVALVQAAGSLPLFLLGLPSGALADRLDRRRVYGWAQGFIAVTAALLAAMSALDSLTPHWLLLLCVANGIGLALRFPAFSALVPDLVPPHQLGPALTLNALAMNFTRIVGPLLAGVMIAALGSAAVFATNAAMSALACTMVLRAPVSGPLPRGTPAAGPVQPLWSAIAEGLRYAMRTPTLRAILLRAWFFFMQTIGLIALLPLVAREISVEAAVYTTLLAAMGAGAVAAALLLPGLPGLAARNRVVKLGVLGYAAATAGAVVAPNLWLLGIALALSGGIWLCTVNTLTMSAQLLLPPSLRARGMAIYQMSIMGGSALGAALWGELASRTSVSTSLLASACAGMVVLALTRRVSIEPAAP